MAERTIKHVFATYREVVDVPGRGKRLITRTARRGASVDLSSDEEARLQSLGALEPEDGGEAGQSALDRALNPNDNQREGRGADGVTPPITVSPPPLGAAPAGDLTTGDTGTEPAQPSDTLSSGPEGSGAPSAAEGYDARGKSLDDVQSWLRSETPTAPQVVQAANGDAGAAETLLEAEQLVSGGDPRKTVAEPLQKIIDGEGGGS